MQRVIERSDQPKLDSVRHQLPPEIGVSSEMPGQLAKIDEAAEPACDLTFLKQNGPPHAAPCGSGKAHRTVHHTILPPLSRLRPDPSAFWRSEITLPDGRLTVTIANSRSAHWIGVTPLTPAQRQARQPPIMPCFATA
jgi:hypothetical protein